MTSRDHRIREIAHRLWEEEGRPHHQEKRHWDMAERLHEEERAEAKSDNGAKATPTRTPRAKTATPRPRKKTAPT